MTVPLTQENRHRAKEVTDPVPYVAVDYICANTDSAVTNLSSMAVVSFAVLLLLLGEGLDCTHGKLEARESPTLLQRMEKLESLLLEQDAKLTSQESLLLRQEQKLVSQENLLRVQAQKISSQENLLRRQNIKLSGQDRQLRWQESKLSKQERLLGEHESSLSRQDKVNSQQDDLLSRLAGRLDRVDTSHKDQTVSGIHDRDRSSDTYLFKDHNVTTDILNHKTSLSKTSHHDVSPRADDTDPLEAVLGQLSQRVTEMGADLQTLRTTVTLQDHDIQDAASSTLHPTGAVLSAATPPSSSTPVLWEDRTMTVQGRPATTCAWQCLLSSAINNRHLTELICTVRNIKRTTHIKTKTLFVLCVDPLTLRPWWSLAPTCALWAGVFSTLASSWLGGTFIMPLLSTYVLTHVWRTAHVEMRTKMECCSTTQSLNAEVCLALPTSTTRLLRARFVLSDGTTFDRGRPWS